MRHALLITAYMDFEELLDRVRILSRNYDCFIHIDRKSTLPGRIKRELLRCGNVEVIRKYVVNWGSYTHILAFMELLRRALRGGV